MGRRRLLLALVCCSPLLAAQMPMQPLRIGGIAWVRVHVSNMAAAYDFYHHTLGLPCNKLVPFQMACKVSDTQSIRLDETLRNSDASTPPGNEEEVAFYAEPISALVTQLRSHGYSDTHLDKPLWGANGISFLGPEGRRISFLDREPIPVPSRLPDTRVSRRIIHAGFVVHDLAAQKHFFGDILGFKPYWTGGPNWDGTEKGRAYYSMQTPQVHEWVEFMLNRPANDTPQALGGANHIALGVADIQAARKQLVANGWTSDAQPKQGMDGKWQLNLFDPDGTRVELMEFLPSRAPCCTPYLQEHPSPNDR